MSSQKAVTITPIQNMSHIWTCGLITRSVFTLVSKRFFPSFLGHSHGTVKIVAHSRNLPSTRAPEAEAIRALAQQSPVRSLPTAIEGHHFFFLTAAVDFL